MTRVCQFTAEEVYHNSVRTRENENRFSLLKVPASELLET